MMRTRGVFRRQDGGHFNIFVRKQSRLLRLLPYPLVGTNFILLGSTKVVAILAIYHDLTLGLLARGAGGLLGMASPEADVAKRERAGLQL